MRAEPLRLLFVCTANIARSPYAEWRARMLLSGAPIQVASAGVPGMPGRPMDSEMRTELEQRGADAGEHVSRSLDADILDGADVVLTFEFAHDLRILEGWPSAGERTFGLKQFAEAVTAFDAATPSGPELVSQARAAARANSMGWDVEDPHGRGRRAASLSAAEIDRSIETVIRGLLGLSAAVEGPRRAIPATRWRRRFGR